MKDFFGRVSEMEVLERYLKQPSVLIAMTGRRRVGKSRLIEEFARQQKLPLFEIQGLYPSKKNQVRQIDNFCQKVCIKLGLNPNKFSHDNWNATLYALADLLKSKAGKKILLLDEISWMAGDNDGFLEIFKTVWDEKFQHDDIYIILCGSVSSWIHDNIIESSNFRGRLTQDYTVHEMIMPDANMFWSKHPHISALERLKVLSVVGGIPKYLESFDFGLTAEQNVQNLFFNSDGFLFKEFDRYLKDSLKSESHVYTKILTYLSLGHRSMEEIRRYTKINDVDIKYLKDLQKAGFVAEDFNFSFEKGVTGRPFYRLSDNYTRFYLKYIEPRKHMIHSGLFNSSKGLEQLKQWPTIVGLQFENLMNSNVDLLYREVGLSPALVLSKAGYIARRTKTFPGLQIDLLIEDQYQNYFLFEFKFKKQIKFGTVAEVRRKITRLQKRHNIKTSIRPYLVFCGERENKLQKDPFFIKQIDATDFLCTKQYF